MKINFTFFLKTTNCLLITMICGVALTARAQGYKNPIIPGFYPDPSVCRVGDDYYLVNSSFEYFPGVPIWHSKDLVNWEQIGNVLNRASQLPLSGCKPSNGIYASTIRYHNGLFYMVTTLVSGTKEYGNFFVTAKNPAGPWSEPVFVNQSGIDPSLFWENGKMYFISNRGLKSNDARAIYESEIDSITGKRLTEPKMIWKGSGGSYVEGPHIYKRNGYYYLLTAEGGTSYGHMVTIARSKNIWGPFESDPANPILSNRYAYSIISGTGHADMVEAADGSWWMVHLAFRPIIDQIHTTGRETCLEPVEWNEEGWPVVNKTGTADIIVDTKTLPLHPYPAAPVTDNFDTDQLDFSYIHLRNPDSANYSLKKRQGYLSLIGSAFTLNDLQSPTFIGKRQRHFSFDAVTSVDFDPQSDNEEAGLTLEMTNDHHYDFYIKKLGNQRVLVVYYKLELINGIKAEVPLLPGPVKLKITGTKTVYSFSYAQGDAPYKEIAQLNTRYLGTEVTGGYNGVIIGMYATGNGKVSARPAYFDYFTYQPIQ